MLAGFYAVERLDSDAGPPRQFGLRPTDSLTVSHNVAS